MFLKPYSSGAKRHLGLGCGMAVAPIYCSDFSHLYFKIQETAGLQIILLAYLLSMRGQLEVSMPSGGDTQKEEKGRKRKDETKESLSPAQYG